MATTFVIRTETDEIKVAHCSGIGNGRVQIKWYNDLYKLIDVNTEVFAIDNGNQAVETIGDLLKLSQE